MKENFTNMIDNQPHISTSTSSDNLKKKKKKKKKK